MISKWSYIALVILLTSPALGQEMAVFTVYLNGEAQGDTFGIIDPGKDVLLSSEFLDQLGIEVDGKGVPSGGVNYVSLSSLEPSVQYTFNEKDLILNLTADPNLLGTTVIDLTRSPPEGVFYTSQDSAFLNYRLNYHWDEDFYHGTLDVPYEGAVRWQNTLFFSSFFYSKTDAEEAQTRLLSYIIKDNVDSMRRLTIGDFSASPGSLGGGPVMGGVSLSKNFGLKPYFNPFPSVGLTTLIENTSDIEIRRNGMLLKKETVKPGVIDVLDIPLTSGGGEVELVIRDQFGRERVVEYPFYSSSSLLRTGLHEYTYSLGFVREEFGIESNEYGDPAVSLQHRYGLRQNFTGGVRVEATEDLYNLGLSGSFSIKGLGIFDTAVAYSSAAEEGAAYLLGYAYSFPGTPWSWSFRLNGFSEAYTNLSLESGSDRPKNSFFSNLSYSSRGLGSLSLYYNRTDTHQEEKIETLSARYSKNLSSKLGIDLTLTTTEELGEREDRAIANLRYHFGRKTSGYATYEKDDNGQTVSASLQGNPMTRIGTGYRVRAQRSEPEVGESVDGYGGELFYNGKYGTYAGRYNRTGDAEAYDVAVSGSLGLVGGSVHMGQPVTDSFALVKIGRLEGIEVTHNNLYVGRTGSSGVLMIPFLSSYIPNRIAINDLDLPFNYSLKTADKQVIAPLNSGCFIEFEYDRIQQILGKLSISDGGEITPAKYWLLSIEVNGETVDVPVGSEGDFYIENLPPGEYFASAHKGEKQCRFPIEIPESDEIMINLGDITCEIK